MNLNGYSLTALKTMETPRGVSYSGNIYYSHKKIGKVYNAGDGSETTADLLPDYIEHYPILTHDFIERIITLKENEDIFVIKMKDKPGQGLAFVTYDNPFDVDEIICSGDETEDDITALIHKTNPGREIESIEIFRSLDEFNINTDMPQAESPEQTF